MSKSNMNNAIKSNFIKHNRDIPQWLRQSPYCFHLLREFANRARREEADVGWQGENIHLAPREFLTGRISTSRELGLTEGKYRNAYRKLERYGYIITIRRTKRYTIGKYLADEIFDINPTGEEPSELPSREPSNNHPTTTNNNDNNDKNIAKAVNIQPSAVFKNSFKRNESIVRGNSPTSIGEILSRGSTPLNELVSKSSSYTVAHEWQFEAERIAKYLGISSPSKSWFKFFRENMELGRKFLLQQAASSMIDAPDVRDKERYFFKLVHKLIAESK